MKSKHKPEIATPIKIEQGTAEHAVHTHPPGEFNFNTNLSKKGGRVGSIN